MTVTLPMAAERARVTIRGAVQGMGFRPFIWRLATELELTGWVINTTEGVLAEVEGAPASLEEFLRRVPNESPPHSRILDLQTARIEPAGDRTFEIRASATDGVPSACVLPDLATCGECLEELFDPGNRRYLYPFTNCTQCGPRFSIITALPYDRANTSMNRFAMCAECRAEYEDPFDRRFHAQPNACPACGPRLELWDSQGRSLAKRDDALALAVDRLGQGAIVGVKGLGGFHLMVAARDDNAVRRLRQRKHREAKPFALMFPSLSDARLECHIDKLEEQLLTSSEAPIVLLRRREADPSVSRIAGGVAPGNPFLGVMLPYTPLHHLLLKRLAAAVVATSGNLGDEPICTDEREAVRRLGGVADFFLVHDRPIVRHVDDSIVRVMAGREQLLRRARGFVPLPIRIDAGSAGPAYAAQVLAVGAHLKNTVAFLEGPRVYLSQHVGDLDAEQSLATFHRVIRDFQCLHAAGPAALVAADLHPDYPSTRWAEASGRPTLGVQHHFAHALSCMAENGIAGPALAVVWDGTGYGPDGTLWGGEFLRIDHSGFERAGHLRRWRLPGGDKAVQEPRRTALGLLYEMFGEKAFDLGALPPFHAAAQPLEAMLRRGFNSPLTSSAGRLFDAVASLVGLRHVCQFEGQAAMDLEFALESARDDASYPVPFREGVLDWGPMIEGVLLDLQAQVPAGVISARFHNALVEAIVAMARLVEEQHVVLSGGCFQNKYLTERTVCRLEAEGFNPMWHRRVPPNDGGIALGQAAAAFRRFTAEGPPCA